MGRRVKQLIYGTFYLFILALIFFGAYLKFLKSDPTCFDGKKNQNEEGVDCGGSCGKICLPSTIRDLKISETKIFLLEDNRATFFGIISNPNNDYAVKNFSYKINILKPGASSTQITSGFSHIYPNDKTYLIFPNAYYVSSPSDKIEIVLENLDWEQKENFEKPAVFVKDYKVTETEEGISIDGEVSNDTFETFSEVKIYAVLKNRFENPIGASFTSVSVPSKSSTHFSIFHPRLSEFNKDITLIGVEVSPKN